MPRHLESEAKRPQTAQDLQHQLINPSPQGPPLTPEHAPSLAPLLRLVVTGGEERGLPADVAGPGNSFVFFLRGVQLGLRLALHPRGVVSAMMAAWSTVNTVLQLIITSGKISCGQIA